MRSTILRWTTPERAKRRIRQPVTAASFNGVIRDYYGTQILDWTGHVGLINVTEPSCGCSVCQGERFAR